VIEPTNEPNLDFCKSYGVLGVGVVGVTQGGEIQAGRQAQNT